MMIRLGLSPEEKKVLIEVLEGYLSDLRMEISDTDNMAFKMRLRARKETLGHLVEKLRKASTPKASKRKVSKRKASKRR